MTLSRLRALAFVAGAALLASCSEAPPPTGAPAAGAPSAAIVDAPRGGAPELFWLPPTVASAPSFSGVFDPAALTALTVNICTLDANANCGGTGEDNTSSTGPTPSRITVDVAGELYEMRWLTSSPGVKAGRTYRVTVLRSGITLGSVDVQVVQNNREQDRVDTANYLGVIKGQPAVVRFRLEQPVASNYIRINEVESSGGTPGDWVELYNVGAAPFDLSGYVFRDNDPAHGYTLPAGSVIPAGGYLVLDELVNGVGNFNFGLGSNDEANLLAPDGSTLVDRYAWTAHAATTYGRCPNATGAFTTTTSSTKGAVNDCSVAVKINEVESSGGVPGDWVELYNTGAAPADLSGYVFRDNDPAHGYVLPAGSVIAPGGYLVLDELVNGVGNFNFGLGSNDEANLLAPDGVTVIDAYAWTSHAATTYGRCPNATGPFVTTGAPTKGAANDCGSLALAVKINEVESSGGTPGDWVEFYNTGSTTADISGYVFLDNGTTGYVIPAGTTIPAGGFLVLDEAQFGFGLGSADDARFFAPDGVTLLDSYTWTSHATTTYGRCPDGSGAFTTTLAPTRGAANACPAVPTFAPWPGSQTVDVADVGNGFFGGNMSGLAYEGTGTATPGVLWAARNGPGALFRLVWNGSIWVTDASNSWGSGKILHYPSGTGDVDAEGITRVGTSIYISAERNNQNSGVSRNSVLLYDPSVTGTELTALREWDLTSDLPANGANLGLEGVTYIPDAYLVANGFRDEATNAPYDPGVYPDHNGGLFFVGVEASGMIYAFALNHADGSFVRVATIGSGFVSVMDLQFDTELQQLWAVCDDGCVGRMSVLRIDTTPASPTQGKFIITQRFERPTGMPNTNNEGFAVSTQSECVGGQKPAFWSDDNQLNGYSLRKGTVSCTPF